MTTMTFAPGVYTLVFCKTTPSLIQRLVLCVMASQKHAIDVFQNHLSSQRKWS